MHYFLYFLFFLILYFNLEAYNILGSNYIKNPDNFSNSSGLLYDGNDYIISDYVQGKIIVYDKEFNKKDEIQNLNAPAYMFSKENKIYISEHKTDTIFTFDFLNKKVDRFGGKGEKQKEFHHPGVIFDFKEKINIIDEYNYRIQVLDKKMNFLYEVLLPKFDYVYYPKYKLNYKVIVKENEVYILDCYNKKIYKYFEKKIEEYKKIFYIKDPIDFFYRDDKIFVIDNFDFNIYNIEDLTKFSILDKKTLDIIKIKQFSFYENNIIFLYENYIYTYDFNKKELKQIKELKNIKKGEYGEPISVAENKKGEILILDKELEKIIIFNKKREIIKEIKDVGLSPSDMYVDEFDNYYILIAGENKIKKYNKDWEILYEYGSYEEFKSNYFYYYDKLKEEDKKNIKTIDKHIYNFNFTIDNKGYIYFLDSKEMKISKYNPFFYKISEFGEKASILDVFKQNYKNKFSWNEKHDDNLTDIFYYNEMIYVLDTYDSKVMIFNENGKFEKEVKLEEDNKIKPNSIKKIYIENDIIYIIDSLNFKINIYDISFTKKDELNFLKESMMPEYIYKNYIIFLKIEEHYKNYHIVMDIGELINDKDK